MEVMPDSDLTPFGVVGRHLRALREAKGLTQLAFAKVSGLSNSRISELERGQNVYLSQYDKYAKGLGYRNIVEMFRAPADAQTRKLLRLWAALDDAHRNDVLNQMRDLIGGD